MAREGSEENVRVWYVGPSGIANPAAPEDTEINAGVDLSPFLTRDGLDTPLKGNTRDASDITSLYNSTSAGTYGGDPITLVLYRDAVYADDDAYTTLTRGLTGFLVICRFFGAGTGNIAAAARVEVWPIEVLSREAMKTAQDENQKVTVTCAVPDPPNIDVAVV